MSKRPVSVDYGAMSLNVGEDRGGAGESRPLCPPDDAAAVQLRAAVGERPRRTRGEDEERGRLASPFELLAEGERTQRATAGEVGGEIERMWVSELSGGTREIRAVIAPQLLPRTQLRMAENEGRLQVELRVGCEDTRRWLAFSLSALGRDLGARLQRDLLVLLFDAGDDAQPAQRFRWPEDADRQ